jgi:lysophospholipase L1-like esterase
MQISTWKVPAMLIVAVMMVGTAQAMTIEHAKPDPIPNGVVLEMHNGGRMVVASETPYIQHQWPGAYWEASFAGSEITASFADPFNILHIYVDGQNIDTESKPGNNNVRISGLSVGPHTIRVEKVTESQNKVGQFFGFIVPEKENALPALTPRTKQIEFIGDSYTVGYGNTAGKRTCTQDELWASTDTQQAFGPLTAKHYNADYQINAFSGRGIVRNYDGFAGDPLPALYPYALYDGKTAYNDPDWQPQIIVIALGTNDFSTPVHAGEKWKTQAELVADYEASYVTFVKSLRAKNPNAAVLLISYDPATSPQISTVRNRLKADGDSQVDFLEITGFTKNACDYHPDTDDDRKISATLINWFDSRPDLWQGK